VHTAVVIQNCRTDGDGGAIRGTNATILVHECALRFNSATGSGGAIYVSGAPGRLNLSGVELVSNSAGASGGAGSVIMFAWVFSLDTTGAGSAFLAIHSPS
jgi:hypothetical protein